MVHSSADIIIAPETFNTFSPTIIACLRFKNDVWKQKCSHIKYYINVRW